MISTVSFDGLESRDNFSFGPKKYRAVVFLVPLKVYFYVGRSLIFGNVFAVRFLGRGLVEILFLSLFWSSPATELRPSSVVHPLCFFEAMTYFSSFEGPLPFSFFVLDICLALHRSPSGFFFGCFVRPGPSKFSCTPPISTTVDDLLRII